VLPDFGVMLSDFSPFGVIVRYDIGVPLTQAERDKYRQLVKYLREFVAVRVKALP
jgi:hypothetical protein